MLRYASAPRLLSLSPSETCSRLLRSSYTDCLKPAHNYNDTRLWKNLVDSNDHYYTNGELAAIFDPNVNTLDYTYDAFEWKICDEQGYPVRKFWETD